MDPVLNKKAEYLIPIAKPTLGEEEALVAYNVVKSGWISQGEKVVEFENLIAKAHGKEFGSACNSGATALILALNAAGVQRGDEVIVPDLTMVAVVNSVLAIGAVPVFAGCNEKSQVGNVGFYSILSNITAKTKAVIIVHTYGEPVEEFEEIVSQLQKKGIRVIEDCAESHYAINSNCKTVGSLGDYAIFSFYSNKIITTGEGGMVLTNNKEDKAHLDRLRMHCFTPGRHFWHSEHAWGYRMTDMQAAIGIVQHDRHNEFLLRRYHIYDLYHSLIKKNDWILPVKLTHLASPWVMPILVYQCREELRQYLAKNGIDHRTYFNPFHQQEFCKQYMRGVLYQGEEQYSSILGRIGIYLPVYPTLTDNEIEYICNTINRFINDTFE
jgi:perosamine synthetase